MPSVIKSVSFDAVDALALARFWAAAVGSDVDEDSTRDKAFVEAAGWVLRPGGFVQFSVLHPVISAPIGRWVDDESGARQARAVGDYFYQGPLIGTWAFSNAPAQLRDRYQPFTITYARRTLAGWLSAVLGAGLGIEAIAEPCADEETAAAHLQVADTRIASYFLIVRARKP